MNQIIKKRKGFFLLSLIFLFSCQVMLIGAYDQVTDQSIQKIQNEVSTIIVKIEHNLEDKNADANKYENFKSDYDQIDGEIESLLIRCSSLPKYDIVIQQIDLLRENMANFRKYHKLGFNSVQELAPYKSGFESEFKNMIILQNKLKREKTPKS